MVKNIVLFFTLVIVQVLAQPSQKKPPFDLKIYDILNAHSHQILRQDVIYYKTEVKDIQKIKIKCQAQGNPAPRYTWKKDGNVINHLPGVHEMDAATGSLLFPDPKESVNGYYQCFAENDHGTGLSQVVQIEKRTLFSFGALHITEKTSVGNTFKIECHGPPKSIPAATFNWKVGELKKPIPAAESESGRFSVDAFGTLHFIYVMKEDAAGGLPYYCGLTNDQTIEYGSKTTLTVEDGTLNHFGPTISHVSPMTIGYLLGEVTLECIFGGYPEPIVTWKDKNGQPIRNINRYEIFDSTRKLKIKDLANEDEGMYGCESSSATGDVKAEIFLNVTSKPIWRQSPTDQTAPVGGIAEFYCQADPATDETPLAPPVWFKNGQKLRSSDFGPGRKFLLSDDGTILYIQNLELDKDLMCVQCNVSNQIGYQFKDASLTVVAAITISSQPPGEIFLGPGNSTELAVEATGGPYNPITYEWQHNGKPLKHNPPHIIIDNNKLTVNSEGMNDTAFQNLGGVYTCVVKNGVQETKVNVIVTPDVTETTQEPVVSAAALDLWWIALLIALIILLIVIILICCMCRQYPKGDYHVDEKERKAGHNPEKELQDSGFHDLSRADDDYPDKPRMDNVSLTGSEKPIESDDDSLTGYGDLDPGKFTEDGSFIGIYADKRKGTNQSSV